MAPRFEQTLHLGRYIDDKSTHKNMFDINIH